MDENHPYTVLRRIVQVKRMQWISIISITDRRCHGHVSGTGEKFDLFIYDIKVFITNRFIYVIECHAMRTTTT